jgi:hypothetical protein
MLLEQARKEDLVPFLKLFLGYPVIRGEHVERNDDDVELVQGNRERSERSDRHVRVGARCPDVVRQLDVFDSSTPAIETQIQGPMRLGSFDHVTGRDDVDHISVICNPNAYEERSRHWCGHQPPIDMPFLVEETTDLR